MINEQIRDKEVRLIGENGDQLGVMSAREALKLAEEEELDLVKIAPTAKPHDMERTKTKTTVGMESKNALRHLSPPLNLPTSQEFLPGGTTCRTAGFGLMGCKAKKGRLQAPQRMSQLTSPTLLEPLCCYNQFP